MAHKLKPDLLRVLQDWHAGKPVKSIELGHVHRMKDVVGFSPTIDASVHHYNDQERAHAYCFAIIEFELRDDLSPDHDFFLKVCAMLRKKFPEITDEEAAGAESLAWKALRFGWARAIEGHKDSMYIEVINPETVAAT